MGDLSARPHVVMPDQLTDTERRLYELARTGTPLAEIGVKLGLTLSEADRRLDALVAKLGLDDRAALRAPLPEPPPPEDTTETPAEPAVGGHGGGGGISRRSLTLGAGAAAGLAAIAGGALFARQRDRKGSPTSARTTTPAATSVSGVAAAGLALIEPVDNAFERRTFAPRELVDWAAGIFFMDVEDGSIDAWRHQLDGDQPEGLGQYRLPVPRFIQVTSSSGKTNILFDRDTERAWKYPARDLVLVGGSASRLVFAELDGGDGSRPGFATGALHVTDHDFSPVDSVEYAVPRFAPDPLVSPDGKRMALITAVGEQFAVALVDLETAAGIEQLAVPLATTSTVHIRWHDELNSAGDFAVELRVAIEGRSAALVLRFRLPWDRAWPEEAVEEPNWKDLTYSPEGRLRLEERVLREVPATGLGGGEAWPIVDIVGTDGRTTQRTKGISLHYGDGLPGRRWLADGTGFYAMMATNATEGAGWERLGFARFAPGYDNWQPLELPPPVGRQWFHRTEARGPVPHPTNPTLFALGRLEVGRLGRDGVVNALQANVQSESGPDHLDPWCGKRDELVFALPHGGHDGGWPGAMIAPAVDLFAPFDDTIKFRVARAGDCVNLRDGPSLTAGVRMCITDGTPLALWEDAVGGFEAGVAFVRNEEGAWCAVRTPDGTTGWVSSAYLDWA